MDNVKAVSHFIFEVYSSPNCQVDSRPAQRGEVCAYCGHCYSRMVDMSRLELVRYNNWHLHRERNGMSFCLPCSFLLRTDDFRRKDVVVTDEEVRLLQRKFPEDRAYLRESIFCSPLRPPFVICLPADYRKHIIFQAQINYVRSDFQVQYGEHSIMINPKVHRQLFEGIEWLYEAGASQSEILQNSYSYNMRRRSSCLNRLEELIAPYRPSTLLMLMLELAKPSAIPSS